MMLHTLDHKSVNNIETKDYVMHFTFRLNVVFCDLNTVAYMIINLLFNFNLWHHVIQK